MVGGPLALAVSSCSDPIASEAQPSPMVVDVSASIEILVGNCQNINDPECFYPTPVSAATVLIYANEEDRFFNENVIYKKTTNAEGRLLFPALAGGKIYYLRTISVFGIRETMEQTPVRGVAFHEILLDE